MNYYQNPNMGFEIFSAQNCLLAMLRKWKSSVDKGKALLMFQKPLIFYHIN